MPHHDVLIIGAGLAGQRAATAAADAGATVAIMSKVHPVRSHSVAAAGGINAAMNPADDWRSHAYDTVKGSDFIGDQDAIEVMCREAPDEILHLEHIGVTFHRNETGHLDLRAFGGSAREHSPDEVSVAAARAVKPSEPDGTRAGRAVQSRAQPRRPGACNAGRRGSALP